MESHIIVDIAVIVMVLCVLSAYFSATETAFTSLNRIKMKNLAADGNKRAGLVLRLEENYDKLLTTILIGNNIVNITMTAISTLLFVELFGAYGPTLSTVVITVVVLIFGEITPKGIAKESARILFPVFGAGDSCSDGSSDPCQLSFYQVETANGKKSSNSVMTVRSLKMSCSPLLRKLRM